MQEDAKLLVKGKLSADNRRGKMQQSGDDDEQGSGEETVIYKVMADGIEVIPADAADQAASTPRPKAAPAQPQSTPAGSWHPASANGNGNGAHANGASNGSTPMNGNGVAGNGSSANGAANGGISISHRPIEGGPAPEPSTPVPVASAPRSTQNFQAPPEAEDCVHLYISEHSANSETVMKLWNICKAHPGQTEVWLHIDNGIETLQLKVSPAYWVVPTPQFHQEAASVLGHEQVRVPQ